ncbi:gluconokinase [Microbacteriaceae bacterium SG_E_30_P1]|uniref:Gluconokinase n=1 Tax=Antiquaquibacter oligotrophicus TaxID=2880260 RepID=A0ABT6KMD2_9MICO|nr:gluconokinase [Antiquaquibacter oligotrophicus]MDH6180287.1 gluconokinase [Antiquaquibacter oligotrophicus]UDF13966.1 gluconokinase [Antiquaquibacter oligotrophicus]
MQTSYPPLIVMGVSGSGKSTIGEALGQKLGMPFIDGDDLHPRANKEKMAAGHPLNDEDRAPWLEIIADRIGAELAEGTSIIVACSALKRSYRELLIAHAPSVVFVHLVGTQKVIAERQSHRHHEYMPNSLLDSQFATLEDLASDERGILVDLTQTPDQMVSYIITTLDENFVDHQ